MLPDSLVSRADPGLATIVFNGNSMRQLVILAVILTVFTFPGVMAQDGPVARVLPVEGLLEYRKGENEWGAVTRAKYLFEDYSVRTHEQATATLVNLANRESLTLYPNSEAIITDSTIRLVSGELSEPLSESNSILAGLANKFQDAQRYTTVRRQVPCDEQIRTATTISLSRDYPELVWKNACPNYSYRLTIGPSSFDIAPVGDAEMVRYSVADIEAGMYQFKIEVLDRNRLIYSPRNFNTLTWLDDQASDQITMTLEQLSEDIFLMTDVLESNGLLVPAMDIYREFFKSNIEDNDMRPFLILSYANLGLLSLQSDEARLYNLIKDR